MTQDKTSPAKRPSAREGYLGADGTISQQGRGGGRLPRDIGTRDEEKRAQSRPAGKTRVRKSDEKSEGNDK